jgi:1,4-dihydroxy-2-naphthoate octaprenyltransferase
MTSRLHSLISRFLWLSYLAAGVLLYLLGSGIAQHLGAFPEPGIFFLGLLWVICLQLFTYYLYRYFDIRAAADNLGRKLFGFLPWRNAMLTGVVVSATLTASATFVLLQQGVITQGIWLLMLLGVAGACVYTIPPARWVSSGYGELLLSVMVGAGIPALGFMLPFGGYHRYLAMIAFPLAALHLVMVIALTMPAYATQQKYEIKTLLTRMGWENAMMTHNLLILGAFFLIAVAALFNFPRFALYPALLALPLGLLQVYYMYRIGGGLKPNWTALGISSIALFVLTVYFLSLAFWTH